MDAPHERPGDLHGYCGGKDELWKNCTCPEPLLTLTMKASTLQVVSRIWTCKCCQLPIDWNALGRQTTPPDQSTA